MRQGSIKRTAITSLFRALQWQSSVTVGSYHERVHAWYRSIQKHCSLLVIQFVDDMTNVPWNLLSIYLSNVSLLQQLARWGCVERGKKLLTMEKFELLVLSKPPIVEFTSPFEV
jgi:hypothetical protein